jgi:hypothetical protein
MITIFIFYILLCMYDYHFGCKQKSQKKKKKKTRIFQPPLVVPQTPIKRNNNNNKKRQFILQELGQEAHRLGRSLVRGPQIW